MVRCSSYQAEAGRPGCYKVVTEALVGWFRSVSLEAILPQDGRFSTGGDVDTFILIQSNSFQQLDTSGLWVQFHSMEASCSKTGLILP